MGFYEDMAAIALDILREFGAVATVTKRANAAYNSTSGKANRAAPSTFDVMLAFKAQPESRNDNAASAKFRYEAIISGLDTTGAVAVIDAEDGIAFAGRNYKVVNPGPISPAGVVAAYDAVLED